MSQEQWSAVDNWFSDKLIPPDPVLNHTLQVSARAGLPAISVAPNQGKLLYLLARIRGARRILEIGTLAGYSTIWLGRALPADGRLISLERDESHAELARSNIALAGLAELVEVRTGLATALLQQLIDDQAEPFDLIFIDADKESNPEYLQLSRQLSRPGTVIIGDNVVRRGRVTDQDNQDPDVLGVRTFFDLLAADPGLTSTAVQTVGAKGWDGLSISVVSN